MNEKKETISLSFDIDKGNYLQNVYFERETNTHILIYGDSERTLSKWFAKSLLTRWSKDRKNPQNIYINWIPPHYKWEMEFHSLNDIIVYLCENFSIISIYGIGSYFDKKMPANWVKNDMDLIAIVDDLQNVPLKEDFTGRFIKVKIKNLEVFVGFNTLEGLNNKEQFQKESFANYRWALNELKLPENSELLYDKDIRAQLPDLKEVQHDLEEMLPHILHHLEKSLEAESLSNLADSPNRFTKAVFKFAYYLCVLYDKDFLDTSTITSAKRVKKLCEQGLIDITMTKFIENSVLFRSTSEFLEDFKTLRNDFISYIFKLAKEGVLHRKFEDDDLSELLKNKFKGFPNLIKKLEENC